MTDHLVYEAAIDSKQPRMRSFIMLRVKPDDGSETGEMFKSRLVAGGNTQEAHRDYDPNRISSSTKVNLAAFYIYLCSRKWATSGSYRRQNGVSERPFGI